MGGSCSSIDWPQVVFASTDSHVQLIFDKVKTMEQNFRARPGQFQRRGRGRLDFWQGNIRRGQQDGGRGQRDHLEGSAAGLPTPVSPGSAHSPATQSVGLQRRQGHRGGLVVGKRDRSKHWMLDEEFGLLGMAPCPH